MKYLLLLLLISCSEQVKHEETLVEVYGVEATAEGCIYYVDEVIPYQPCQDNKIQDACWKYKVGDRFFVRWEAN